MNRGARVLSLLVAAALAVVVAQAGGSAGHAEDPPAPVSDCARATQAVQVQMVIDESSSLIRNDEQGRREQLVTQWIGDLTGLAVAGYDVRLSIAGYGSQWRPILDWTQLNGDTAATALASVGSFTKTEADTDHALALIRANESLDAVASEIEADGGIACPMILWFTDGGYDFGSESQDYRAARGLPSTTPYSDLPVTVENEEQIKAAGIERMCGTGGIVERLRSQNTDIVAVALNPSLDFRLVQELADGTGFPDDDPGPGCRLPYYPPGTFIPVESEVTTTTTSAPPTEEATTPACDASLGCLDTSSFEVPRWTDILDVEITSSEGDDIRSVSLRSPDGTTLAAAGIGSGTQSLAAGSLRGELVSLSSTSVLLSITADDPSALVGSWSADVGTAAVDGTPLVVPAFSSELIPRLVTQTTVERGVATLVPLEVVDESGTPVATEGLVLAPVVLPTGEELTWESDGTTFVIAIPETVAQTELDSLDLRPRLAATPDEGVRFEDVGISIQVRRPEYPTVTFLGADTGAVRPPVVDTPGSAEIEYTVAGPAVGSGCATGITTSIGDDEIAEVVFDGGAETCASPSEEITRTLLVTFDSRVEGRFCGSVSFELTGEQASEPRQFDQPICIRTERGPTLWTRLLAVLFGLLGLLPLAILAVINRFAGQLPPQGQVTVATPSVIDDGGRLATLSGAPLLSEEIFREPDYGRWSLPLLDGRHEVRSFAITRPRLGKRGIPSLSMLFSGPRSYLIPIAPEQTVVIGSGPDRIHAGALNEPVRLPRDLDGLWILEVGERAESGRPPLRLAVVRVFGRGVPLNDLSDAIRTSVNAELRALSNELLDGASMDDF